MFSLFYGLWNYLFSKTEFHVLILGIDKAGKTTLLEKLKTLYSNLEGLPPDRIVPTVGLNIGRIEGTKNKLVFWDLGGQKWVHGSVIRIVDLMGPSLDGDAPEIFQNAGSVIRIVDLMGPSLDGDAPEIFQNIGLRTIWEKYYEEAHAIIYVIDASCPSRFEDSKSALEKVLRHEDLRGAPVLVLANKQDLSGAVSAEELARYLDLKELDERLYMFEAVSAYDGSGIKEAVDWLVEVMERSKRTETLRVRAGGYSPVPS